MIFVYHQKEFLLLTVQAVLCGVLLGAIYDLFRILGCVLRLSPLKSKRAAVLSEREYPLIGKLCGDTKKEKRTENVILFFRDVLFMLIAAVLILVLLFFRNDGKFRLIVVLLAAVGGTCYYISIGRIISGALELIVVAIRIITAYLLYALKMPVRFAIAGVKKLLCASYRLVATVYLRRRFAADTKKYEHETLLCAQRGFLRQGINDCRKADKKTRKRMRNNGGKENARKKA